MKKHLFMLLAIMVLILGACGTSEEVEPASKSSEPKGEQVDKTDETEDVDEEGAEDGDEVLTDEEEMLIDEDKYSMKLLKVEKQQLDGDEQIKVTFEVENKSDDYLEIFADTASADGEMINNGFYDMFIKVSPGKKATDSFNIYKFEEDTDFELPELNEELEIDIIVNDEEWEFEDKQTITINF